MVLAIDAASLGSITVPITVPVWGAVSNVPVECIVVRVFGCKFCQPTPVSVPVGLVVMRQISNLSQLKCLPVPKMAMGTRLPVFYL